MALRIPYPCYGSEPPVSNGVTCRSTAPNFFRPASINRASAKLENRVIALRNVFLLTAAGSFFVLILTCRSVCASCNSSVCAEDVSLPHSAFCSPALSGPASVAGFPAAQAGLERRHFSPFSYPIHIRMELAMCVTLLSPEACVCPPRAFRDRTSRLSLSSRITPAGACTRPP